MDTTYCDHCADPLEPDQVCAVVSLPRDVDSANAGESAALCRTCYAVRVGGLDLAAMTDGYIRAALWADCGPRCTCGYDSTPALEDHEDDCPARESGGLEHLSVSPEAWHYVRALVGRFVAAHGADVGTFVRFAGGYDDTPSHLAGHCLRLSSGGHGSGFFDRDPEHARMHAGQLARYGAARARLQDAAQARPFSRPGGGDVWQVSDDMAEFDRWSLEVPAPGEYIGRRYVDPSLTSAQRQAYIDTGRVPCEADTYPVQP